MLDQLIQTAQQHLGPQLQQLGVKPEQLGSVFNVAQESVTDRLKNEAMRGGLHSIVSLFNGQGGSLQSNSIVSSLSSGFVSSLVSKLGLEPSIASKVSGVVIPFIMEKFSSSETGSASSATDLISKLGFGGSDITSALGGLLGGDKENAGDLLGGLGKLF